MILRSILFCIPLWFLYSVSAELVNEPFQDVVIPIARQGEYHDSTAEICRQVEETGKSECYPKLFQATQDFQPIQPGQILPPGLHVRVDVQTGEKSAKFAVPGEGEEYAIEALPDAQFHKQDSQQHKYYTTSKLPLKDRDAFATLIDGLVEKKEEDIISVLDKLEEIVHEIDWGFEFISTPLGIPTMTQLISHPNSTIRTKAALVLGSALQNNHSAQKLVLEAEFLPLLYIRFETEKEPKTMNRLVYALAGLIRSYDVGITQFLETQGLMILHKVYQRADTRIQDKIMTLLLDVLNPSMMGESSAMPVFPRKDLEIWCGAIDRVLAERPSTLHYEVAQVLIKNKDLECKKLRLNMFKYQQHQDLK